MSSYKLQILEQMRIMSTYLRIIELRVDIVKSLTYLIYLYLSQQYLVQHLYWSNTRLFTIYCHPAAKTKKQLDSCFGMKIIEFPGDWFRGRNFGYFQLYTVPLELILQLSPINGSYKGFSWKSSPNAAIKVWESGPRFPRCDMMFRHSASHGPAASHLHITGICDTWQLSWRSYRTI